jgi:hypothetical protein
VAVALFAQQASADDQMTVEESATAEPGPTDMEAGLFIGGFISNYYHQFYDESKFVNMTRPLLNTVDPEIGLRYAYFPHAYFGVEGEGSVILAGLQDTTGSAQIYGLGVQGIVQLPGRVTPFIDAGIVLMHTSSDTSAPARACS